MEITFSLIKAKIFMIFCWKLEYILLTFGLIIHKDISNRFEDIEQKSVKMVSGILQFTHNGQDNYMDYIKNIVAITFFVYWRPIGNAVPSKEKKNAEARLYLWAPIAKVWFCHNQDFKFRPILRTKSVISLKAYNIRKWYFTGLRLMLLCIF